MFAQISFFHLLQVNIFASEYDLLFLESKIKVLFYKQMKRASERITSLKRESWRKYPSAVIKPQAISSLKHLTFHPTSSTLNVATSVCEAIIAIAEEAIDRLEAVNFINSIEQSSQQIYKFMCEAMYPSVEASSCNHQNCPQDEPEHILTDLMCSADKPVERKGLKRQLASISTFTSPLKELKHKQKLSISTKELHLGQKRSIRSGLVPLNMTDYEQDTRSNLIQTFYRQKFAKEEMNQQQNISKPEAKLFRKANQRDKQQYAFDYDGQKIPILSSNSTKNNPLKILKTVYKVHKDRTDLRHVKKVQQSVKAEKYSFTAASNNFLESFADLPELKKGIEQNVRWAGKLNSIKLISQNDQFK